MSRFCRFWQSVFSTSYLVDNVPKPEFLTLSHPLRANFFLRVDKCEHRLCVHPSVGRGSIIALNLKPCSLTDGAGKLQFSPPRRPHLTGFDDSLTTESCYT